MLSPEDERTGVDLILDDQWHVLLRDGNEIVARFDPRDYTSKELQLEVRQLLRNRYPRRGEDREAAADGGTG